MTPENTKPQPPPVPYKTKPISIAKQQRIERRLRQMEACGASEAMKKAYLDAQGVIVGVPSGEPT